MEILVPDFGLMAWTFISLLAIVFWIVALIDISRSDFKRSDEKYSWILLAILLPVFGSVLYFMYGRKNRIKQYKQRNGIFQ